VSVALIVSSGGAVRGDGSARAGDARDGGTTASGGSGGGEQGRTHVEPEIVL